VGAEVTASDAGGVITGATDGMMAGTQIQVEDVTNDGVDDLIFSAPLTTGRSGDYDGALYVMAGPLSTSSSSPFSGTTANVDYVAVGQSGALLGTAFTTGDVTGDSTAELIAAAPTLDFDYTANGAVLIWTADLSSGSGNESDAKWLYGNQDYYYLGDGALLVADLTNNGTNELIIGSRYATNNYTYEGVVDILATPLQNGAYVSNHTIDRVTGGNSFAYCGTALAAADFDMDGHLDLAVGCPFAGGGAGLVAVFLGDNTGVSASRYQDAELVLEGSAAVYTGQMGTSITFSDIDGDGMPDLIANEENYTASSSSYQTGRVAMVFGGTTGTILADDADGQVLGDTSSGFLGASLAGGEDVDGDGYDDLLIGRPGVNLAGTSYGDALLFTGGEW
jgi:hypothetical protein